jgi:hypothetical protein
MLTADDVAEVGNVVDIGQRAGDEYVAAAGNRQLRRRGGGRHGGGGFGFRKGLCQCWVVRRRRAVARGDGRRVRSMWEQNPRSTCQAHG